MNKPEVSKVEFWILGGTLTYSQNILQDDEKSRTKKCNDLGFIPPPPPDLCISHAT